MRRTSEQDEMMKRAAYYHSFIEKVKEIMKNYNEPGNRPKLFGKIENIIKSHPHDNKAIMKELYQLHSHQHMASTSNPLKAAKKFVKETAGLDISTHSHPISEELYKAFGYINIEPTAKLTDQIGVNRLNNVLKNLEHKPGYQR